MHLAKALTNSVSLFHDDYEWVQTIDYEHIPFRCRKCHEHGHLFRDYPLNLQSKTPVMEASKDAKGFTKVPNRRRHAKKTPMDPDNITKSITRNSFDILNTSDNIEDNPSFPLSDPSPSSPSHLPKSSDIPQSSKATITLTSTSNASPNKDSAPPSSNMELDIALALSMQQPSKEEDQSTPIHMEEEPESVDLAGLDILKLEAACKQKEYSKIHTREIERLEEVLTRAQQNKYLGIQEGSPWDGRKILKETKKRGRKIDLQRTIILEEMLVDSGRFPNLTKFYKTLPHCSP